MKRISLDQFFKSAKIGQRVSAWVLGCERCGILFLGQKNAKYCSPACTNRVTYEAWLERHKGKKTDDFPPIPDELRR